MNLLIVYPFLLHSRVAHGGGLLLLRWVQELSARGHSLFVLSLAETDPAAFQNEVLAVRQMCQDMLVLPRPRLTPLLKAIRFLSPGIPPHARNLVQREAQTYVRELTGSGNIDVVLLIFTATGEYLQTIDRSRCAVVLVEQEIETRRYRTSLRRERNLWRWLHAFITWQRARRYEQGVIQAVDQTIAVTAEEQAAIRQLAGPVRVDVIPAVVDVGSFPTLDEAADSEANGLLFVGSFAHPPNVAAMEWFCGQVFPSILTQVPSARLCIVGQGAREAVGHLAGRQIQVVGPVEDIRPWLAKAAVFVSPIRSGGGARIKNLETMASGLPLVTTSLGAQGLGGPAGCGYLVADDAPQFAEAVVKLLSDRDFGRRLGRAGRQLVERAHDARVVIPRLEELLQSLVDARIQEGKSESSA